MDEKIEAGQPDHGLQSFCRRQGRNRNDIFLGYWSCKASKGCDGRKTSRQTTKFKLEVSYFLFSFL
jgi:hypothetical protein